jgi:hypothetical protein
VRAGLRRRARIRGDAAWLRRARLRYVGRCAAWLEADRDRVDALGPKMIDRGLYAPTTGEIAVRCSIVALLMKHYGIPTRERQRWLLKSGWTSHWGWWGTAYKRARAAKRADAS